MCAKEKERERKRITGEKRWTIKKNQQRKKRNRKKKKKKEKEERSHVFESLVLRTKKRNV